MTNGSRPDDDASWHRPAGATGPFSPAEPAPGTSEYTGPPPTIAPPPGWRLPVVAQPPPARMLPVQNTARLDAEEQAARTLTYGVAMVSGAVMLILLLLICGRLLF